MKFKIKALDTQEEDLKNTKKELEIIEDFYRYKYDNSKIEQFSIFDSTSKMYTRVVTWKKNNIEYVVSIDYEFKLIAKGTRPGFNWEPFEKDELKLFDLLDYDLHAIFNKDTKQDITDWVWME